MSERKVWLCLFKEYVVTVLTFNFSHWNTSMCFKLLLAYHSASDRHITETLGGVSWIFHRFQVNWYCLSRSVDRMIVRFGLSHVFLCMVTEAVASPVFRLFLPTFASWEIPHYLCRMLLRPNSDWIVTDTWIIEPWQWSLLGSSRQCVRVITTFDSVHPVTVKNWGIDQTHESLYPSCSPSECRPWGQSLITQSWSSSTIPHLMMGGWFSLASHLLVISTKPTSSHPCGFLNTERNKPQKSYYSSWSPLQHFPSHHSCKQSSSLPIKNETS